MNKKKESFLRLFRVVLFSVFILVLIRTAWVCDDAYITFRVVDNFINGYGLKWNINERVQVFTHPFWMLLNSAIYFFTKEIYFSVIFLSIIISIIAVLILTLRIAKSLEASLLSLILLTSSKAFVDFSTSGLENPLTHFLAACFLNYYFNKEKTIKNFFIMSLFAGLATFNRMDTVLLFLAPLIYILAKNNQRRYFFAAAAGFSPFFFWELFSIIYYGFPFPNPAYAKLGSGIKSSQLIQQGFHYLLNSIHKDHLTMLVIASGLLITFALRRVDLYMLAASIFIYIIYIIRIGGDFMSGRFLTPPIFFAVAIISQVNIRNRILFIAFFIVIFSVLINPYAPIRSNKFYSETGFDEYGIADERGFYFQETGLIRANCKMKAPTLNLETALAARQSGSVAICGVIGFFGFFAGPKVHIIDPLGLGDALLARLPTAYIERWRIGHFERVIPTGYIETLDQNRLLLKDENIRKFYQHLRSIIRGPIWNKDRLLEILKMNLGVYNHFFASASMKNIFFGASIDGRKTSPQKINVIFNKWTGVGKNNKWIVYKQDNWFRIKPRSGKGQISFEISLRNINFKPGIYKSQLIVCFASNPKIKIPISVNLKVYDSGKTLPPFGWLDIPKEGDMVKPSGCLVAGWALDDIEVTEVWVKREPLPGESPGVIGEDGLVLLGQASFLSGVRQDIEMRYPKVPLNYRAAWCYNLKPEHYGKKRKIQIKLYAVFRDKEGLSTLIGPRTVYIGD